MSKSQTRYHLNENGNSCDRRPKSYDVRAARCEDGLMSIDDIFESVSQVSGTKKTNSNQGKLVAANKDDLLGLVAPLECIVPRAGVNGEGFVHIGVAFRRKHFKGCFDSVPDDSYEAVLDACESLGELWDGSYEADAMTLACNAVLQTVLRDDKLRTDVLDRVRSRLNKSYQALLSSGTTFI